MSVRAVIAQQSSINYAVPGDAVNQLHLNFVEHQKPHQENDLAKQQDPHLGRCHLVPLHCVSLHSSSQMA